MACKARLAVAERKLRLNFLLPELRSASSVKGRSGTLTGPEASLPAYLTNQAKRLEAEQAESQRRAQAASRTTAALAAEAAVKQEALRRAYLAREAKRLEAEQAESQRRARAASRTPAALLEAELLEQQRHEDEALLVAQRSAALRQAQAQQRAQVEAGWQASRDEALAQRERESLIARQRTAHEEAQRAAHVAAQLAQAQAAERALAEQRALAEHNILQTIAFGAMPAAPRERKSAARALQERCESAATISVGALFGFESGLHRSAAQCVASRDLAGFQSLTKMLINLAKAAQLVCFRCGISGHTPSSCKANALSSGHLSLVGTDNLRSTQTLNFLYKTVWNCTVQWGLVEAVVSAQELWYAYSSSTMFVFRMGTANDTLLSATLMQHHWDASLYVLRFLKRCPAHVRGSLLGPPRSALRAALESVAPRPVLELLWELTKMYDPSIGSYRATRDIVVAVLTGAVGDEVPYLARRERVKFSSDSQKPREPPTTPLMLSIWFGDAQQVETVGRWYLEARQKRGCNVLDQSDRLTDAAGRTCFPLVDALVWKEYEVAAALLSAGFSPAPEDTQGPSGSCYARFAPIAVAAFDQVWPLVLTMLRSPTALLAFCRSASSPPGRHALCRVPFHWACFNLQWAVIEAALAACPQPLRQEVLTDAHDRHVPVLQDYLPHPGSTPLHYALRGSKQHGRWQDGSARSLVQLLLSEPAVLWIRDSEGQTPISLALMDQSPLLEDLGRAWEKEASGNVSSSQSAVTQFLSSLTSGSVKTALPHIRRELDWLQQERKTRLSPVLQTERYAKALISETLKAPAFVCAVVLPAILAEKGVSFADAPLTSCIEHIGLQQLRDMLARGASHKAQGHTGSVLHAAVLSGRDDVCAALLDAGADAASTGAPGGDTPLHLAVRRSALAERATRDLLVTLLVTRAPACLMLTNKHGETPLNKLLETIRTPLPPVVLANELAVKEALLRALAASTSDCVAALTWLFKDPNVSFAGAPLWAAATHLSCEWLKKLLDRGASLTAVDPLTGNTPLHAAVRAARVDAVQLLLEAGVDLTSKNYAGDTALHFAARDVAAEAPRNALCVKLARRDERAMNVPNNAGVTPFKAAPSRTRGCMQDASHEAHRARLGTAQQGPKAAPANAADSAAAAPAAKEEKKPASAKPAAPVFVWPACPLDIDPLTTTDAARNQRLLKTLDELPQLLSRDAAAGGPAPSEQAAAAVDAGSSRVHEGAVATLGPLVPLESAQERSAADAAAREALSAKLEGEDEAARMAAMAPLASLDELNSVLRSAPWELVLFSEPKREWASLDAPFRRMVVQKLLAIAQGFWKTDGSCKNLSPSDKSLQCEVWRCKWSKAGRILWDVAPDHTPTGTGFRDVVRIWCITLDHGRYERAVISTEKSIKRGNTAQLRSTLTRLPSTDAQRGQRLPQSYLCSGAPGVAPVAAPQAGAVEHAPPASADEDTFTLLKSYSLTGELMDACVAGLDEREVEFSFRVSPIERELISKEPVPPAAVICVGRSGTGKTTVAVLRLWARYLQDRQAGVAQHALFVTASATLRSQVASMFRRLRAATYREEGGRPGGAQEAPLDSLLAVPHHRFPLFLTAAEYLRLLDATLPGRFLPASAGDESDEEDLDGAGLEVDLAEGYASDSGSDVGEDADGDGADSAGEPDAPARRQGNAGGARRREVTYAFFLETMWTRMTSEEQRRMFRPEMVFTEIRSYLRGSAEAVQSPDGRLPLQEYLELGKKRAHAFNADGRTALYPIFLKYEVLKKEFRRYDVTDLVTSIYGRLEAGGWPGVPLHALTRDEVQDFTQAELYLDIRVVADPSGIFLCGDTAQTIARGLGFRFTDVVTLFYHDNLRRAKAGLPPVALPKIETLEVNYRTHSGVLDAASVCIATLKQRFPFSIDALPAERAHFRGLPPLLLPELSERDVTILLSGSDRSASTVEFGAHQAVLVRDQVSAKNLPAGLRGAALVLTVPQAKGLEFDDVVIANFFSDSPCKEEWRILLSYLDKLDLRPCEAPDDAGAALDRAAAAEGFLRPLAFDPERHVTMAEELKHLYTAITRAKCNVVFTDRDAAARAPFYHLLRRMGLARSVRSSILDDDGQHHGLTRGRSGPAEWALRAANLCDGAETPERLELAAASYRRAGDAPHALACTAASCTLRAAALPDTPPFAREKRGWYAAAADAWLTAGAHVRQAHHAAVARAASAAAAAAAAASVAAAAAEKQDDAPPPPVTPASPPPAAAITLVSDKERRSWLLRAARALIRANEYLLAARLFTTLEKHENAGKCFVRAGQVAAGARALEAAAAAAPPADASRMLLTAVSALGVRQPAEAIALMRRHPAVLRPDAVRGAGINLDKVIKAAAVDLHKSRNKQGAIDALALLGRKDRETYLKSFGYLRELAEMMTDSVAAAEVLLVHDGPSAAAARLRGEANMPALRMRLYRYQCAAAVEKKDASHALAAAALFSSSDSNASRRLNAHATLLAGRLSAHVPTLLSALQACKDAACPLGQAAALSALTAASGSGLPVDELSTAKNALSVARTVISILNSGAGTRGLGPKHNLASLDELYGGCLGGLGATSLSDSAALDAQVTLRPDDFWAFLAASREMLGHPGIGSKAKRHLTACAAELVVRPPASTVLVPLRTALSLVCVHYGCTVLDLMDGTAARMAAQAGAPADLQGALEAAVALHAHAAPREEFCRTLREAGQKLALPDDAWPSCQASVDAGLATRRAAENAVMRMLFPPDAPCGICPAALEAFHGILALNEFDVRQIAARGVLTTSEAQFTALTARVRAGSDGGEAAARYWQLHAFARRDLYALWRAASKCAVEGALAAKSVLKEAQPPRLACGGKPFAAGISLLHLSLEAARRSQPLDAATALIFFLDMRCAAIAARTLARSPLPSPAWTLGMLELACAAAFTSLASVQQCVCPADWVDAFNRTCMRTLNVPRPRLPGEPRARAEAVALVKKNATSALARALRLLLHAAPWPEASPSRCALLPLSLLLTAALPSAAPVLETFLTAVLHLAVDALPRLSSDAEWQQACAAATAPLAHRKSPESGRAVTNALLRLRSGIELVLIDPDAPPVQFDGPPKQAAGVAERAFALPKRPSELIAALLVSPSLSELSSFGAHDAYARSDEEAEREIRLEKLARRACSGWLRALRRSRLNAIVAVARRKLRHFAVRQRWAAKLECLRAKLSLRKEEEEAAAMRAAREAARASNSYAERLKTVRTALRTLQSNRNCPVCRSGAVEPAQAAPPARAAGLSVRAAEFVPRQAHESSPEHAAAVLAFGIYESAYQATALALKDSDLVEGDLIEARDSLGGGSGEGAAAIDYGTAVDGARSSVLTGLQRVEDEKEWAAGLQALGPLVSELKSAVSTASAWLKSRHSRAAAQEHDEFFDAQEDLNELQEDTQEEKGWEQISKKAKKKGASSHKKHRRY